MQRKPSVGRLLRPYVVAAYVGVMYAWYYLAWGRVFRQYLVGTFLRR